MDLTAALLLAYAGGLVATGLLISRRVRRAGDFFVAGRSLAGGLVFASLLAANIGAGSTVGATGLGYEKGLSAWWWSGSAALGCLALGLWVAPRLHGLAQEHGFLTVGDFLAARYDRSVRGLVGLVLWVGSLSILAGQLLAMAWAFGVLLGLPKALGCALAGAIVVAYVGRGGLLASVWVNVLELVVLLAGFALALPFTWRMAGGWPALGAAGSKGFDSPTGMGLGEILGLLLALGPSFVVSPGLLQKTYGARTPAAARAAALGNAASLAVFAFVPALLGMAMRVLRPTLAHPELALPTLFREVLPPWLGGLGLAALFAAEISTADAVLFMLATSLSKDLYQAFVNPQADDARLLRVGRRATVAAGAIAVLAATALPSVADALKIFYGLLTACLFVPLLWGLASPRPGPGAARLAIGLSVAAALLLPLALRGSPLAAWLPGLCGIVLGVIVFAAASWLGGRR